MGTPNGTRAPSSGPMPCAAHGLRPTAGERLPRQALLQLLKSAWGIARAPETPHARRGGNSAN
eukprot:2861178-Alexandrium_andersonii.AAC.1